MTTEVLTHVPAHPLRSRQNHPAEHAFYDEWIKLVQEPLLDDEHYGDENRIREGRLGHMLCHLKFPLTDRHSRLASAFITWLGTNVGGSVLLSRLRLGSFYLAWANQNKRTAFVDGGFRSSDFLTAPQWSEPVVCEDARELEVFEAIATWLDTQEGKAFIKRAEARVVVYERKLSNSDVEILKAGFKV